MTPAERFLKVLSFEQPDRIPVFDFGYWPETITRWYQEGLPTHLKTYEEIESFFKGDRGFELNMVNHWGPAEMEGIEWGPYPPLEKVVLEEDEGTILYGGEIGLIREHKKTGSISQTLKYPIETLEDFEKKIVPRMNGSDQGRVPAGFDEKIKLLRSQGEPAGVWLDGFLEYPRELIGIENLCYAYYDEPELVQGINAQHLEFIKQYVDMVLTHTPLEYACIVEDMAYKNGSMISKEIFDRFMRPYYVELVSFLRSRNIQKILLDSDGCTVDIIPWMIDLGIDGHYPLEVIAGSTPQLLREKFPKFALIGGVNKFALEKGPKAIDAELEALCPVIEKGGYIPSVDHKVPPTVSLYNYQYYIEKKMRILEKFAAK